MRTLGWILGIAFAASAAAILLYLNWPDPGLPPNPADDTERSGASGEVGGAAGPESSDPGREPASTNAVVGPVSGRVIGPDGEPVYGARIALGRRVSPWPRGDLDELEAVLSDPNGRFRFSTARDVDLVVCVVHDDFAQRRVAVQRDVAVTLVRMEHGFNVTGFVVDLEGRGARDVLVTVEPGPWSNQPPLSTRSADDGSFELTGLSVGPLGVARITARHRVFAPATVSIQSVGVGEPVRLQFSRIGLALTGRVVHAGEPERAIAGAQIRVFPSTSWNGGLYVPYATETDDAGRFRLTGLGVGSHTVVVRHAEYSTLSRGVMVGRSSAYQVFEVVPRSRVGGRLTGPSVGGVELRIETNGGELARAEVGPDGRFEFAQPLSVGSARVDVMNGEKSFARTTSRDANVTIEDAPRTQLELEVQRPSVLRGRVVDQRGKPVAGVLVSTPRYRLQTLHPDRWVVSTGADGSFEFHGLPVGAAALTFEHEEFAGLRAAPEIGQPGQDPSIEDIVLLDPGIIRGRVMRGGLPLAGATVFAGRDRAQDESAVTGPDGHYELRRLPPGRYRILSRWSTLPLQVASELWTVDAGQVIDGVDLEFPPGRKVEGLVMDSIGLPVAEARILVVGRPGALTATDAQGAFEMEVPEGDIELEILSRDFRAQFRESVPANADVVRVRLPWVPHGSVKARVVGLPGGRPVSRAFVRLTPLDVGTSDDEALRRQRTIASRLADMPGGRLRSELVPAGRSRLAIQAPGWAPFVTEITLERGEELDLGTVRLEPGAEVKGIVTDGDGDPIAGAWVHLGEIEDFRHEDARLVRSGRDGSFVLSGVSPDAAELVVGADGWAPTERRLRIPDDLIRAEPLRIVLERGSSIVVQLARDGEPAADYRLVALRLDEELISINPSGLDGRILFAGLPAGAWFVSLFGDREEQVRVEVDGTERTYEIQLGL